MIIGMLLSSVFPNKAKPIMVNIAATVGPESEILFILRMSSPTTPTQAALTKAAPVPSMAVKSLMRRAGLT